MDLKQIVRNIPDFPEPGIQFKDIESITENPEAFRYVIDRIAEVVQDMAIDKILGLDARGFLFGSAVGYKLGLPIVMARKAGKLGGDRVSQSYSLEYGSAEVELQKTAVQAGDRVAIVDDLLATGGTAAAAAKLVDRVGGHIELFAFVIELVDLKGRERLGDSEILALIQY